MLEQFRQSDLSREAQGVVAQTDPVILGRAVNYLYTRETKSSFAIEGERAGQSRAEKFVVVLERAGDFNPGEKRSFIELQ